MYISNFILMLIIGDQAANQNTIVSMIKIIPIGTLMLTTILAPLTEELIFRKSLKDAIPICPGYISVSFAFGMMAVSMGLSIPITTIIAAILIFNKYPKIKAIVQITDLSEWESIYCLSCLDNSLGMLSVIHAASSPSKSESNELDSKNQKEEKKRSRKPA